MGHARVNDTYVLLTGARNNAGDFLIGHRARSLLQKYRPDRKIQDFEAWKPLTDEQVDLINRSRALLLTGGPALQKGFWPKVYPLVNNLDQIKVPIITFGLGWKSVAADARAVNTYSFSPKSLELLNRIASNGYSSSVRDYHTWEVLKRLGLDNFQMTGCPALYEPENFDTPVRVPSEPTNVVFSMGVEAARSARILEQSRELIKELALKFGTERFKVAFHHSLDDRYVKAYGKTSPVSDLQLAMAAWLDTQGINYVDISGELNKMLDLYGRADLHIGYRIHAHILMLSLSKPSIVISEDGRGIALRNVTGGLNFDAFTEVDTGLLAKAARRLGSARDRYGTDPGLPQKIIDYLTAELSQPAQMLVPRSAINNHFSRMHAFLKGLP